MKFPNGYHEMYGEWDKKGIWWPDNRIKNILGAFDVRYPSRKYPYSYIRHFYTTKFWKLFEDKFPKEAKKIIVDEMKIRMS